MVHTQHSRSHFTYSQYPQTLCHDFFHTSCCQHDWLADLQPKASSPLCRSTAGELSTSITFEGLKGDRDVVPVQLWQKGDLGGTAGR